MLTNSAQYNRKLVIKKKKKKKQAQIVCLASIEVLLNVSYGLQEMHNLSSAIWQLSFSQWEMYNQQRCEKPLMDGPLYL